jgi:hypothetical protein
MAGIFALKKQKDKSFDLNKAKAFLNDISENKIINGFNYRALKNTKIKL